MKKRILSIMFALALMFELFATPIFAATYTTEEIVEAALELLYYNEGSYGSINKNDNGAVSVGKIQWHATRALNLLKTIVNADTAAAEAILGSALYNEIITAKDWSERTVTSEEAAVLKILLTTEQGKAAQDALATKDVTTYIKHGQNLGITDAAALVYFADLENQGGYGMSKRVATSASATAGSYSAITLTILHNAALDDSVAGKYSSRRKKAYSYCQKLEPASPSIPVTGVTFSCTVTPSTNSARVNGSFSYTGSRPSSIGFYLGTNKSNMHSYLEDTIGGTANPYEIGYNITYLANDTTYFLQFYSIVDGKTVKDDTIYSFTTEKDTKAISVTSEMECGYFVTIPANYYLQCFETPTSKEGFRHIDESNSSYRLFCTKRLSMSDHTVRYYFTDSDGNGMYFNMTANMSSEVVHNYTEKGSIDATCTEAGYTETACACGDVYSVLEHAPLGHNFKNGTCTRCGEKDGTILMGDANDDSYVNNVDAMLVLQYTVGLKDDAELKLSVCDVSGDGRINNVDAMMILQFAVGLITEFTTK